MLVLGLAMIVSTLSRGGGALALGVVLGAVFALIGGRPALARPRRALPRRRRLSPTGDDGRPDRAGRAREGLRRGSGRAGARIARGTERAEALLARGLGEPALFAITLSAIVSSIFFSIGVVAGDALGLTPVVFLIAAGFFVITMATYVEGNSLHPERGGASTFARYAFDEFWSFIAGWAILLDYLIVMALAAVAISDYLAAFWGELGNGYVETLIAALALLFVAVANIRGLGADRLRTVLRLSLVGIVLLAVRVGARVRPALRPRAPSSTRWTSARGRPGRTPSSRR